MGLHYLSDYEYARSNIRHSSFAELQAQVVAHCPPGFECVVPMALFHELVWQMRKDEEDHLRRPIFEVQEFVFNSNHIAFIDCMSPQSWITLTFNGTRPRAYVCKSCPFILSSHQ